MGQAQSSKADHDRLADASRSNWSRRSFLRLIGAAAAGTVLQSCSTSSTQPTPSQGAKVQLVYQDWRTEWFAPMVQQMLEQFHASHPNIRVYFTPDPENLETKMAADFQAGTAADVFQGCCTHFPAWAQMGYALDLRPYIQADLDQATIADWDAAQYKALASRDGQQFGLPKYHGTLAVYYNKDLFDWYKVDYPDRSWDHDDYLAAMQHMTADQDGDGETDLWGSLLDVSWDRIQVHVNGWGGHLVDPDDPTRCSMAQPEALAAMEWIRKNMWDDRVMATPRDIQKMQTRRAFVSGQVAMVEDGSWALKDILEQSTFRVGVAPFPAGPVRHVTLATTDGFGIYAGTRHPDAAWELLKFLISREYGRAMARTNLLQPARASLVDVWVRSVREQYPHKANEMDIGAFAESQLKGYSVTAEIFANMYAAQEIADTAWQRIFTLGKAPVELMQDACLDIEEVQRGTG